MVHVTCNPRTDSSGREMLGWVAISDMKVGLSGHGSSGLLNKKMEWKFDEELEVIRLKSSDKDVLYLADLIRSAGGSLFTKVRIYKRRFVSKTGKDSYRGRLMKFLFNDTEYGLFYLGGRLALYRYDSPDSPHRAFSLRKRPK